MTKTKLMNHLANNEIARKEKAILYNSQNLLDIMLLGSPWTPIRRKEDRVYTHRKS